MAVGRGFSQALQSGYDVMDRAMETRDRDRMRRELGEAGALHGVYAQRNPLHGMPGSRLA